MFRFWIELLACASLLFAGSVYAWIPGGSSPGTSGFIVDVNNRTDVLSFHNCVFSASESYPAEVGWTGNLTLCNPGSTGTVFKDSVIRRVNYYRALSGMRADVVLSGVKSSKSQQAALMMAKRGALSHTPTPDWLCYTAGGAEAAGKSNLSLGAYGPGAVDNYMVDSGSNNYLVGHRRWILYSGAKEMGTGDVPGGGGVNSANSLWVIGDFVDSGSARFVAWPNAGYSPFPVMPSRWSLSYKGADFTTATVSMKVGGIVVPTAVISRNNNGFGDNTIVWEPSGLPTSITSDVVCDVTVSGIGGSGVPVSRTYSVILFDPLRLGREVALDGSAVPSPMGETYRFAPIIGADRYEVGVSEIIAGDWVAGAESGFPSMIEGISSTYSLVATAHKRTGAASFHLTFPTFSEGAQSFEIDRNIIPTATSALIFYDKFRFVTSTSRLSAEISADNGVSWQEIWGRNGSGSVLDGAFVARSVSLSAYAGKVVRVRFSFRHNGASAYLGILADTGLYIDDISISSSTQLSAGISTSLPSTADSFRLDSTSSGSALSPGRVLAMRVRPMVGCRWFGYGPLKTGTVGSQAVVGFPGWAAGFETLAGLPAGTLSGDKDGDLDGDGVPNLVEYAFSTSPVSGNNDLSKLPRSSVSAGVLRLEYRVDTSLPLSISPQASQNLSTFYDLGAAGAPAGFSDAYVSQAGPVLTREARLPLSANAPGFLRIKVVEK